MLFRSTLRSIKLKIGIFDERLSGSILRGMSLDNLKTVDHKGIVYADKNVWIYNIVDDGNDGFVVIGVSPSKTMVWMENDRVTECSIIASIRKDSEGKIDIKFLEEYIFEPFDRLSIHQGLLDKIYDKFGIRENVAMKEEFTKLFYEKFCTGDVIKKGEYTSNGVAHHFLPGLSDRKNTRLNSSHP